MLKFRYLAKMVVGATFAFASGAFAQETGFCGQPLTLTGGSYSIAGEGALPIDTVLSVARGEPAYLQFVVERETGVTIETFSNDLDPLIVLFDSAGRMVRSDDDGSGTLNARLGVELSAGKYCAQIRTLTDVPPAVGFLPPGFSGPIPVRLSTGIAAGAGGCFTQPGLVRLDSPLATGAEPLVLSGQVPSGGTIALSLAEPMGLSIAARSNEFDTILTVEDSFGAQLGTDDDGGGGTNSYLGFDSPLAAGDYCISVTSYDAAGGAFDLILEEWSEAAASRGQGSGAPINPCGDPAATTLIGDVLGRGFSAQEFRQTLANDHRFYRFETSEPLELRLTVTSGDFDTVLGLYDGEGLEVGNSDDADGLGTNSRIEPGSMLPAGRYCVAVSPFSGEGSGSYQFVLEELTEEALLAEAYASGELLPSASSGIQFTDLGLLERSLRSEGASEPGSQWFLFEVDEESLVVADAASPEGATRLVLFDYEGSGLQIAESVVDPEAPTTRLVRKVGSGIYAIALVRDAGADGREASLMSIQRYIRPPRRQ